VIESDKGRGAPGRREGESEDEEGKGTMWSETRAESAEA